MKKTTTTILVIILIAIGVLVAFLDDKKSPAANKGMSDGTYKLVAGEHEIYPGLKSSLVFVANGGQETVIANNIHDLDFSVQTDSDSTGGLLNTLHILEGIQTDEKIAFYLMHEPYHGSSGPLYVYDLESNSLNQVEGTEDLILSKGWDWPSPDGTKAISPGYEDGREVLRIFDLVSESVSIVMPEFEDGFGMFANDGQGINTSLRWTDENTIEYSLYQDVPGKYWREQVGTKTINI